MKKKRFFGSILVLALASVFMFSACNNPNKTTEEQAKEDLIELKNGINEDRRDFTHYKYTERDKFVVDANEELDNINRDIDKFKADLKALGDNISAETKASYERSIAELEKIRDDYKVNIDKAKNSTEDTWEQTRQDVGNAYDKTKDNIKKGWEDMKSEVNKGVDKMQKKLD